jgi:predicted Zn-ribbon and HTH transcriptional regulator
MDAWYYARPVSNSDVMVKRTQIIREGVRCERCGYEWTPGDWNNLPMRCANIKCRSPYWKTPPRRPRRAKTR